jgi:hypothetical protein
MVCINVREARLLLRNDDGRGNPVFWAAGQAAYPFDVARSESVRCEKIVAWNVESMARIGRATYACLMALVALCRVGDDAKIKTGKEN